MSGQRGVAKASSRVGTPASCHLTDRSKTGPPRGPTVTAMPPQIAVIEVVVSDMAASLAFYRRLGLDVPPALRLS